MKSKAILLLELLSDWQLHSNVELSQVAGWRFGGHLHSLRQMGCSFIKEGKRTTDKAYVEYWAIASIPKEVDWKSGNRIKLPKKEKSFLQKLFS